MKYVEELKFGDMFTDNGKDFIKTTDCKKSKSTIQYNCVCIQDGGCNWIDGDRAVQLLQLYKRDNDGNILPVTEYKDPYKNISQD